MLVWARDNIGSSSQRFVSRRGFRLLQGFSATVGSLKLLELLKCGVEVGAALSHGVYSKK